MENSKMKVRTLIIESETYSAFCVRNGHGKMYLSFMRPNTDITYFHLYLISDEEVKKGDYITNGSKVYVAPDVDAFIGLYKIVASTLPLLGIPSIPQSFIEKYVEKNGDIQEVMIEMERVLEDYGIDSGGTPIQMWKTKGIKTRKDNTVIVSRVKDTWSREEVVQQLIYCVSEMVTHSKMKSDELKYWNEKTVKWADKNL